MQTINAQQLKSMKDQDSNFTLVNTLPAAKFEQTKIPGAVNIPQDQNDFVSQVEQKAGGKDQTVVTYCANESCDSSSKAAEKLEQAGFSKVFDFEAGAEGWQKAAV